MRKSSLPLALLLAALLAAAQASADRLPVPMPYVSLREPGQAAIVAWRDGVEVMVLSVKLALPLDVKVPPALKVVEITPLPSEAKVEAGSTAVFYKLLSLLRRRPHYPLTGGWEALRGVDVVFTKVIGPHKITLIRADGGGEVVEWLEGYAASQGLSLGGLNLTRLREAFDDYIGRGFSYFAVDVIDLGRYVARTQPLPPRLPMAIDVLPLVYEFKSPGPYYPLKITSAAVTGSTSIKLFLITEWPVSEEDVAGTGLKLRYSVALSAGDLRDVDDRLWALFRGCEVVWVTVLEYRGDLDGLRDDLLIAPKSVASGVAIKAATFAPLVVSVLAPPCLVLRRSGKRGRLDKFAIAAAFLQLFVVVCLAVAPALVSARLVATPLYTVGLAYLLLAANLFLSSAALGAYAAALLALSKREGDVLAVASCLLGVATLALTATLVFLGYTPWYMDFASRATWLLVAVGALALPLELAEVAVVWWKLSREAEARGGERGQA